MDLGKSLSHLKEWAKRIPSDAWFVLALFIATRAILSIIGVASRFLMADANAMSPMFPFSNNWFLDVFGNWDTHYYVKIATEWYANKVYYSFFPLYPFVMRIINIVVHDVFLSGLIVSNVCLLIGCYYLYKLVKLDDDRQTAFRSVKYLLLWPTSFILSGVYSEALFLPLGIAAFYYAKKGNWLTAGILGCFLALTRNIGVFIIVPLVYIYAQQRHFNFKEIKANALALLLIPLGYCYWLYFNYIGTGNPLTFAANQELFGRGWYSILNVLFVGLGADAMHKVWAGTAIVCLVALTVFMFKIGIPEWMLGMYSILVPLSTGLMAMLRFTCIIFPLFILCAKLGKSRDIDMPLTVACALLQGFLMVFWGFDIMT